MAASDPTTDVPTPTGTLQGVAAFSWDGTNWQPTGRAGPSVATPTGVLRGVAAFNGGPAWQPAALAQPGVATPSGVLDGVAVYTWSGAAWTPPGGTATPSTATGALRGVAAFNWDGAAWQPAGQAGPSVATPYGVLDGVAMFGWSGSAWAAVGAPSLSLDFMNPGTLDPRITFTRASTGTYFNSAGVMQTAATNAPRWDYNPSTLALNGLLIEEARTNLLQNSSNMAAGTWNTAAVTVTAGQAGAPDGTATMGRISEDSTTNIHYLSQLPILVASTTYVVSVFAKMQQIRWLQLFLDNSAAVGGYATFDLQSGVISGPLTALGAGVIGTASIQAVGAGIYRCSIATTIGASTNGRVGFVTSNTPTPGWVPSYAGNPANGLQLWGAHVEQGTFPTSYIPTTAAAVTRAADIAQMTPIASWFTTPAAYSMSAEFIPTVPGAAYYVVCGIGDVSAGNGSYLSNQGFGRIGGGTTAGHSAIVLNAVNKQAGALTLATYNDCNNGGPIGSASNGTGSQTLATRMTFGASPWALDSALNGWLRNVRHWPRVLTNAEMQAVTT